MTNLSEKKKFVLWLIVTIVWWLSPADDLLEGSLGPFALSDEVVLSIMTAYRGYKAFLKTNSLAGAFYYADKGVKKVSQQNEQLGNVMSTIVDSKLEESMSKLDTKNPLNIGSKREQSTMKKGTLNDMDLFS